MTIDVKLIDKLLADHGTRPADIAVGARAAQAAYRAVWERAMQVDLTDNRAMRSTTLSAIN